MQRTIRTLVLFVIVVTTPVGAKAAHPDIDKIVKEISATRIESTIRKLVGFETRNSLSETKSETKGIGAARRWIKVELERCSKENGGRLRVEFDEHLAPVSARHFLCRIVPVPP